MLQFGAASTTTHIEQILALQKRNHRDQLSAEAQAQGFVFAQYTPELLRALAAVSPQVIALDGAHLAGYCLSLPPTFWPQMPGLKAMFDRFEHCQFRGRALREYRLTVGGQVCVDAPYRGQGLMAQLYGSLQAQLVALGDPPQLCVTEVATRNVPSLRAHLRMGFEQVDVYEADGERWVVIAWPL